VESYAPYRLLCQSISSCMECSFRCPAVKWFDLAATCMYGHACTHPKHKGTKDAIISNKPRFVTPNRQQAENIEKNGVWLNSTRIPPDCPLPPSTEN
jgi:hypothetical protein